MTLCVRSLFFPAVLLVTLTAAVHSEILPLRTYTTSHGLAHDRVYRIARDSRGLLWFCTGEGLSRFDGVEFKNYTQDNGLPHRAVYDLLETRDGELWAATGDGIVFFDPMGDDPRGARGSGGPMFRVFRDASVAGGTQSFSVMDLAEDNNGVMWAAASHGLYRLDKAGGERLLKRVNTEAWGHAGRNFVEILVDRAGALWIGAERGLYRLLPDGSVQKIDPKLRIESLLEDREGRIWAGSGGGESSGLYQFTLTASDEPQLVRIFDARDGLSGNHWMNALFETSDGRILVGASTALCEYIPSSDGAQQFRVLLDTQNVSLGEDIAGNVWIGTASRGAQRLAKQGFVGYDESDGLKGTGVASIMNGAGGGLYVITTDPHRFDGKRFVAVSPKGKIKENWGKNQISFQDRLGEWWVAGYAGLQRYPAVARIEDLEHTPPKKIYTMSDGLVSNSVFQLFEDSRGDIWISNVEGADMLVHRWERSTDKIHLYRAPEGMPRANCPTAFGEDRGGNVWMGFYTGGLVRHRNGEFDVFTADDGLPAGFIRDIHTDRAGRLWVTTTSGGVVRIDQPTSDRPQLATLTTADGLASNQTGCVTEDDFGRIYIGTGRGLNRLDPSTGSFKLFTTADGLPENSVMLCERDATGTLWLATYNGLARYMPRRDETTMPPTVFISELKVNGESVKRLSELGDSSVELPELNTDQRQLQVGFFALGFATGEHLRYQYKLNDTDWSDASTQRSLNLNLAPGEYEFAVRAVNADGVSSVSPARVSFSIARPVWQRWWFLLLATLAASLAIYALYRYRLERLLELERVRVRIAADLHDDIGASLSKIAILSEIAGHRVSETAPDARDISESLAGIAGTSREMVDSMADIVWAINPAKDKLSDLLQRMRNLAGEMCELNDIRLAVDVSEIGEADLPLGADVRRETYLIFKETINNVIRHSLCQAVKIEIARARDELVVTVEDDGQGFDTSAERDETTRGGNGLPNMRRRAADLGGGYHISSRLGQGTRATLRVPLKAAKRFFRRYPNV